MSMTSETTADASFSSVAAGRRSSNEQAAAAKQQALSSSAASSSPSLNNHHHQSQQEKPLPPLARKETRAVRWLRITVLTVLLATAVLVCVGVLRYTRSNEQTLFTSHYQDSAFLVLEKFHDVVESSLGALDTLSVTLTSFALFANQTFPFVTLPDFALRGANLRVATGSHILHYMPVVTDATRLAWEEYAETNRFQIDAAHERDGFLRNRQDAEYGIVGSGAAAEEASSSSSSNNNGAGRFLSEEEEEPRETTILEDGTGFHPHIWSTGAIVPPGDEPVGSGPYLPAWQRSPISGQKQALLNLNWAHTRPLEGLLPVLLKDQTAAMGRAQKPIPEFQKRLEGNLKISQYREHVDEYVGDPNTFFAYPVFDRFPNETDQDQDGRRVVGVLATSIFWSFLFSHLLPPGERGIVCVVENSYNQTFSYRIDGPEATYLGLVDAHDDNYNDLEFSADVSSYLQHRARPINRAYTTVPLNEEIGQYKIRVYPSQETEEAFVTNDPVVYTVLVACAFAFTSIVFILFSYFVERRHRVMTQTAVANAEKAAADERDLNEFLSHEVRNPLSAAISACTFVSSAVEEPEPLKDSETQQFVREDVQVINASLRFINDFLRSMLDINRANFMDLQFRMSPVDLLRDVIDPVSILVYQRDANFEVRVDCPENILVLTDCLRLKQVVLNLVRNASKFVERGFIRLRTDIVNGLVQLFVEDSGPGIPAEKRSTLFSKYQQSLDLLSQGTGIGLCLSKKLMVAMGGDLWLDESYDSGIDGCPGARFVVQLNVARISIESSRSPLLVDESACGSSSIMEEKICDDDVKGNGGEGDGESNSLTELPEDLSLLFVDDDVILRKLFVRAARRLGPSWTVEEAASGEMALKKCESEKYDVIFLDQYMASFDKVLTGTETARALRTKGVTSKICGLSANELTDNFLLAGADDFILKPLPCAPDELKRVLLRLLGDTQAGVTTTPV